MDEDNVRQIILNTLETSLEVQIKAIRKIKGEDLEGITDRPKKGKRRQSLVDNSIDLLTEIGKPMHVNEITQLLLEKYGRVTDRDAISSALGKKVRQGVLVKQVAPATFDLINRGEQS